MSPATILVLVAGLTLTGSHAHARSYRPGCRGELRSCHESTRLGRIECAFACRGDAEVDTGSCRKSCRQAYRFDRLQCLHAASGCESDLQQTPATRSACEGDCGQELGRCAHEAASRRPACITRCPTGKDRRACVEGCLTDTGDELDACKVRHEQCKATCGGGATTTTSTFQSFCGDGVVDQPFEECDGEDLSGAVCPGSATGAFPDCTNDCVLDFGPCERTTTSSTSTSTSSTSTSTSSTVASSTTSSTSSTIPMVGVCGDGELNAGEECDDGNPDPTDGCTNACTLCGDGIVTAPEQCDEGPGSCTAPPANVGNACYNDLQCDTDPGVSLDGACKGGNQDSATCAPNCMVPGCGDGLVEPGETCDDGNTADGDNCPSTCVIEACDENAGSDFTVDVTFAGSDEVAALTIFLDYPEGRVSIPGSGGSLPAGIITDLPGFAFGQSNDLDYALRESVVDTAAFAQGLAFRIHFETCMGAPTPTAEDFSCVVEVAGNANAEEIGGVTCAVMLPGTSTTSTSSTTSSTTTSTSTSSSTSTSVAASTTSTSTTTSSSTTTIPLNCGNGQLDPGETCDDGNTSNNDSCPSDCNVESCTAGTTQVSAVLSFDSPGVPIAGLEILVDYPEGLVDYVNAQPLVAGLFPPQDFGHALFVVRASASAIDPTSILRMNFNRCMGAVAPTNGDFGCEVQLAVDSGTNQVAGVTCTVTLQ